MIFIIKGSRAKVNQTDLAVQQDASLRSFTGDGERGGRDVSVVGEGLVVVVDKEDVFGFQVGVDEVEIVEDYLVSMDGRSG